MENIIKKIIAVFTSIFAILPSFFGISSVYKPYKDSEKYAPSLGQIVVDTDMSVPRIFIIQNGSSDYVIIRGANASPSEKTAAVTLQSYLRQISGVTIPIVDDSVAPQAKEIVVGKTNREGTGTFTVDRKKLGDDGLNIFISNEKLVIAGGEKRGTLYGVYTYLEEVLGCRWFAKDLTVVPQNATVTVRRSLNIEQIPVFENRDVFWACAFDESFSVANKINGEVARTLSDVNGDGITYAGNFVHTLGQLLPEAQYFQSHPEYYAYTINRKRETTQLCLSNPNVLKIVTNNVLEWLRANPSADIISVSQNDNYEYCVCDNCRAIDLEEGSQMGTMLRFVNAVAKEVEKEFPNVAIDTLAYQYTRKAPSITKPRDNVIIRLCTIEACFAHPLVECVDADKTGRTFKQDIEDWQKICNRIYVWDYTTNFSHYITPFPNFGVLQPNVQFFAENNVTGLFEQGCYQIENSGEFAQLKAYILAKLLWDPYTNFEKHINEFLRAYYGEGFQNIHRYIDFVTARAQVSHFKIYDAPASIVYLSNSDIEQCDKWWDAAEAAAKTEAELSHVQCSRLQLRYYKNYTKKGEFSYKNNKAEYGEALYDDFMRFGIVRTRESDFLKPKDQINFNRRVQTWY